MQDRGWVFPFVLRVGAVVSLSGLALLANKYVDFVTIPEPLVAALRLIVLIGAFAAGLAVYLLPHIVAKVRNHRNASAISLTNILTGWTVAGWLIALVWACTDKLQLGAIWHAKEAGVRGR
jgi:Superinfection immunity protein